MPYIDPKERRLQLTKALIDWINLNRPFARVRQVGNKTYKTNHAMAHAILNITKKENLPLRVWWDYSTKGGVKPLRQVFIWRLDSEITDSNGKVVAYRSPFMSPEHPDRIEWIRLTEEEVQEILEQNVK